MTGDHQGSGDELWDEFVREIEKGGAIHEPSAAERLAVAPAKPSRRRIWAAIAALCVAVAVAGIGYEVGPGRRSSTPPRPSAAASAGPTATKSASSPMVTADQAFPAQLDGFTRVEQSGVPNCTGNGMVGPNLTTMIDQSKGCRGVIEALYRDAADNEYTIVVFGMKDPTDVAHLMVSLGADPTDHEVGFVTPPSGSGLRALPTDSGLVQAFAGTEKLLVVGLAQWSDGRAVDFQTLTDKLGPLLNDVTKAAAAHDHA
ncbi:hypothetical protein [Streptacidiphilus sp. MAP5-3]|uniref:hypothetical protein n=1 Tax=unclassified Streptacidiphilus TaxID=2643834 RepID=UPI00351298F3